MTQSQPMDRHKITCFQQKLIEEENKSSVSCRETVGLPLWMGALGSQQSLMNPFLSLGINGMGH